MSKCIQRSKNLHCQLPLVRVSPPPPCWTHINTYKLIHLQTTHRHVISPGRLFAQLTLQHSALCSFHGKRGALLCVWCVYFASYPHRHLVVTMLGAQCLILEGGRCRQTQRGRTRCSAAYLPWMKRQMYNKWCIYREGNDFIEGSMEANDLASVPLFRDWGAQLISSAADCMLVAFVAPSSLTLKVQYAKFPLAVFFHCNVWL